MGYSKSGTLLTKLFPGAVYNSYEMRIYIQVYDNDEAFATFEIEKPIVVLPDKRNLELTIEKLISDDPLFSLNIILNEGSYLKTLEEVQVTAGLLNDQSLSEKASLISSGQAPIFPQTFGPLSNYSGVLSVSILLYFILKFSETFYFRI